jgi:hypothetical protein
VALSAILFLSFFDFFSFFGRFVGGGALPDAVTGGADGEFVVGEWVGRLLGAPVGEFVGLRLGIWLLGDRVDGAFVEG